MTHDFEVRENTGWEICKNCGQIKAKDSSTQKPCEAPVFDEDDYDR